MKNLQYFPFERNQYYYGKLMTQQDFVSEQTYMNDKRRLINRFIHGTGVAAGLQVVKVDDYSFSVEAGLALDEIGREVLVDQPTVRRLDQMPGYEQLSEQPDTNPVYLCLTYHEEGAYPSKGKADDGDSTVYEKSKEGFRLYLTGDPYEEDGDTLKSLCSHTVLIFENEDLTVTQELPVFVQSGETFPVTVKIRAKRALSAVELSFTEMLVCLLHEGGDSLSVSWSGNFKACGDYQELSYQLEAYSLEQGTGELTIPQYKLKVTAEGQEYHSRTEISGTIRVCGGDTYHELVENYFENNMNHILGTSYPRGIYLAAIYLNRAGRNFLIDRIERLPFSQRVYSSLLNMALTEKLLAEVKYLREQQKEALLKKEDREDKEQGGMAIASGVCEIAMGVGGKAGEKYFSEEIVHGLGLGRMKITLSLDSGRYQYIGSEEVFEDMRIRAVLAAKVNYERGSFVVGLRLLEHTPLEQARVHWIAERVPEAEDRDTEPHIRILPDKPELRVMQSRYFRAKTENLEGMTILWEVSTPNGGTISREGHYTAPDTEGIYEIAAFCQEMPSIKNSVFVIVRE